MKRFHGWALLASVMVALAMFIAACGGDDKRDGATGTTTTSTATKGGKVTFLAAGDVDFLDPGQTYYAVGYMVHFAVNRTLYSYKPEDASRAVPDLATGPPQISDDNKTITVTIRKGVRYAPPVNREVKAQDIKYAFERAFSKHVPNPYVGSYFSAIEGVPEGGGAIEPISGITTPDDHTIVFKLTKPQATFVAQALVMPVTTPVPEEYARKHDAKTPSTYNQYVAFTGPYMVKNDPSTGKVIGHKPGQEIQIVRNEQWDESTDYRPAYLEEITIQEGNEDLASASRRVLNGKGLLCCDAGSPPAQVLKRALSDNKDQVSFVPIGQTRYIAFNTQLAPFDNINVRKAVIAASDRNALRLARGGETIGDIASGFIPPGVPGYEEAGGAEQNTDLDFLKNPAGDPELSKKYMLAAKNDDPSLPIDGDGKWTGGDKLLTVAVNADPGKKTSEVFQNQLEALGFKLNFRVVSQDALYTKFYGVPDAKVAVLPNLAWGRDFPDAQTILDPTFNGKNIIPQGNVNWAQLDVESVNDAMGKAAALPAGEERNEAWAEVNHMVAEQAPALPVIWDKQALVASANVNGVVNVYYTLYDLSFTSLK